ncbi:phosphate-induced protein 1 conserved region-domain-containing protein [Jimgerdemannia flammicorona]|uniref:Phosphate-induced protein 1 conserved region-domain-containing protein n=2 Tax=Jimgerdemannia flammicorona TaxID=994334 RepID=A0A433A227_9FUNG|nr:phosphate-induced protein 1 conserved region-domain-containing protein [Jimgerdemannia flammicorona]RUS25053.1 phosphate-induced protein 1 conserved region-domain-containing protein [Jimgerdemannia flammicorona]
MKYLNIVFCIVSLLVTTAIAVTPNVGGRLIGMSTRPRPKGLISNFHVSHVTIGYQGGPIMTGAVNVYQIFYGDWSKKAAARKLLSYFINNLSSSRWFDITREYFELDDLNRTHYVTGPIRTAKYFYDNYSHGKSLSHIAIRNIVRGAIKRKYLPTDYNGIYVVYPSEDVTSQDFCETLCGYHFYFGNDTSAMIKYAFIGDPSTQCPSACSALQYPNSPNGLFGADSMANILGHELVETLTDPLASSWIDSGESVRFLLGTHYLLDAGSTSTVQDLNSRLFLSTYAFPPSSQENADKCAWQFGNNHTKNGNMWNIKLGARKFLLQENLSLRKQACVMKL